eukprot:10687172-Karenia_brevis.AAC.1
MASAADYQMFLLQREVVRPQTVAPRPERQTESLTVLPIPAPPPARDDLSLVSFVPKDATAE